MSEQKDLKEMEDLINKIEIKAARGSLTSEEKQTRIALRSKVNKLESKKLCDL